MTHKESSELYRNKFRNYTEEQVAHALADCHDTLQTLRLEYDHPYSVKLWAEIDALRIIRIK